MKPLKHFLTLTLALAIFSGCKKDTTSDSGAPQPPANPFIYGTWIADSAIIIQFDSSINDFDTSQIAFVDTSGNLTTYFERFLSPNHYYQYWGTTATANITSTFTMTGINVIINEPDSVLPSSHRTILAVNDSALVWKYVVAATTPPITAIVYMSPY